LNDRRDGRWEPSGDGQDLAAFGDPSLAQLMRSEGRKRQKIRR
jgi:hypothetical protein